VSESNMIEFCTSCGHQGTLEDLKKRNPMSLTCCPERKVVDLINYLIEHEALEQRVKELEKRNEELENKKVDLYEILLDSFIEILKQHGVTEVCILNEFTRSIENQCQQALPPADKEEVCEKPIKRFKVTPCGQCCGYLPCENCIQEEIKEVAK